MMKIIKNKATVHSTPLKAKTKVKVNLRNLLSVLGILFLFTTFNCTTLPLVNDTQLIDQTKKVAFISSYLNKTLYDISKPPADVGSLELIENDTGLGLGEHQINVRYLQARQKLIDQVSDFAITELKKKNFFSTSTRQESTKFPNFSSKIKTDTFGGFSFGEAGTIKAKTYLQAEGLKLVTFKEIIKDTKGDELPVGDILTLKEIGDFAKKLGVDAVAILEFDLGYKFYSKRSETQWRVRASTSLKLLIVHQSGKILFESVDIIKGDGDRYESSIIGLNKTNDNDFEFLEGSEIYQAYSDTLKKNIDDILAQID